VPGSRSWKSLGWLLLLGCLLAGCRAIPAPDSADDTREWQGTWKLVSSRYDGRLQMANMEWIVNGDHYTIRMDGHSQVDPNTFKLDASRKHIDVIHHDTPPGTLGGNAKGIYEISGNLLIVCYDLTGERYPKSFDAPRGSRQVLYKFRRE